MATLKKYNLDGKETGTVKVGDALSKAEANGQMVKDYIVAIRNNARQWSACTKTRGEVSHSTKKPHPQKGTGGARQGSLVAPHYRGGGRAHGPKPKFDQHIRVNRKERRAAIRSLLAEKIQDGTLKVLESTTLKEPKTQTVANFLDKAGCAGRTLFVAEGTYAEIKDEDKKVSIKSDAHQNFVKSLRNIPKTEFSLAANISGYDIALAKNVVMTEAALKEVTEWLTGN